MSTQNENQDTNRSTSSMFISPFTFVFRPGASNDGQQSSTQQEQTDTSQQQPLPSPQPSNFPQPAIFEVQIPTNPTQQSNNNEQTQQQPSQFIQFVFYPVSGLNGEPPVFFFTPLFMAPQEQKKPRASETAMKNLPIVKIIQEHVDAKATCPICLDAFTITPSPQDDTTEIEVKSVREMPCEHMFCESCLFEWLRQNNTCPLCRKEIEAEIPQEQAKQQDQQAGDVARENATSLGSSANTTIRRGAGIRNTHTHRHPYRRHVIQTTSCALDRVGCCGESNLHSNDTNAPSVPIITLPQCHHRFHASCLRTSLLVEGYSLETSSSLNFHCPTCRTPAMLQSDILKVAAAPGVIISTPTDNVLSSGLQLPLTIRLSDEMDLD